MLTSTRAIIVRHLREFYQHDTSIGVACVFLNHKDRAAQRSANLLASIWMQLSYMPDVHPSVSSLYRENTSKGTRPSLEEVITVLRFELRRYSKVFIILDALDECEDGIASDILNELCRAGPNVNVLVTSRYPKGDQSLFEHSPTVTIRPLEMDILRYVETRIKSSNQLYRHIARKPSLREEILDSVLKKAHGMCVSYSHIVQSNQF
jgi:Cdc6-like AAA superfamily ATPase